MISLKFKYNKWIHALLAGLLLGITYKYFIFWLAWIAFIPLLIALKNTDLKKSIYLSGLSGFIQGLLLYSWIFSTTQKYAGSSTLLGIPLLIIAALYLSFWMVLFAVSFKIISQKLPSNNVILEIVTGATIWMSLEFARNNILPGFPWLRYTLSSTQSTNEYLLQTTSIIGIFGLSYIIFIINALFANGIFSKDRKLIYGGAAIIIINLFYGYTTIDLVEEGRKPSLEFSLIQGNFSAETRWMEETGDSLVNIYFELNKASAERNSDFIVWTETAIPWNFEEDDDFIKEILKITQATNSSHIMSYFVPVHKGSKKVYDSAFMLEPDGKITGFYSKNILLSGIEEPFLERTSNSKLQVPFLSESFHEQIIPGDKLEILRSKNSALGILMCNESLDHNRYNETVKKGASILVTISNDSWFETDELKMHHFYITKMFAVESRRDIIFNSNQGYSGIIAYTGVDKVYKPTTKQRVISVNAAVNYTASFYATYKIWILMSFIFTNILLIIIIRKYR